MATALEGRTRADLPLDLFEAIDVEKKKKNAVILAHYYQDPDIQDVADVLGDSLALAQAAQKTRADVIAFCGVHFMAETAKILNPEKIVVLPDLAAGCSLADTCPDREFETFVRRHPGHVVISYINCTAGVKALSDIICTSSNAEKIIRSVPDHTPIIFAPDKNLGRYLARKIGREMVLWPGSCIVHETFSLQRIQELKRIHPRAQVIAHPECEEPVLMLADYIGSTSKLLEHVVSDPHDAFIVATESHIMHQMKKAAPAKTLIPAPSTADCNCNECPHMARNTMEKLYLCLRDLQPRIEMAEPLRLRALKPLERMLDISSRN